MLCAPSAVADGFPLEHCDVAITTTTLVVLEDADARTHTPYSLPFCGVGGFSQAWFLVGRGCDNPSYSLRFGRGATIVLLRQPNTTTRRCAMEIFKRTLPYTYRILATSDCEIATPGRGRRNGRLKDDGVSPYYTGTLFPYCYTCTRVPHQPDVAQWNFSNEPYTIHMVLRFEELFLTTFLFSSLATEKRCTLSASTHDAQRANCRGYL